MFRPCPEGMANSGPNMAIVETFFPTPIFSPILKVPSDPALQHSVGTFTRWMNIPSAVLPTSIQGQLFLEVHGRSCQNSALDVWVVHVSPSRGSRLSRVAQRHGRPIRQRSIQRQAEDRARARVLQAISSYADSNRKQHCPMQNPCRSHQKPNQIHTESNRKPILIHAEPMQNISEIQSNPMQNLTETQQNHGESIRYISWSQL